MVVVVTGASGQLGQSLQFIAPNYPQIKFHFYNSSELNITDLENCKTIFSEIKPDFCINAAAYTAVDKAESEPEKAYAINVTGAENLAKVCKENNTVLLHISTDFVFDGNASKPYTEDDTPNPTGVYGQTKLDGEKAIQEIWEKHFIIRTSWVYSQFGNNFMKTMLRLGAERDSLSVVNDQIGTPTNAVDLAEVLVRIITFCHAELVLASQSHLPFSIFHLSSKIFNFSNEGQCSWYEFAKKIFEINKIEIDLQPIPTSSYPTPAKRPSYSVLDKSKIKEVFGSEISEEISDWEERLKEI
ncbi:dTDP-4-dehydrorhamnose reductase [Flavobacterium arsenatis]|uniref:dTDP-4-dehydrorhamnose reductase n=1 Tax=Flavobacterium arsenatis TaxID=1484332 RepID=A0ABU1TSC7_9FLAO|nr:dTDP-4-dehydrorhamnose reductase [Flavobacterium arsenatis]MDR6968756.1 dTDP-4-dehydrorhamnose reductase [Flavobacterium arsenatis]